MQKKSNREDTVFKDTMPYKCSKSFPLHRKGGLMPMFHEQLGWIGLSLGFFKYRSGTVNSKFHLIRSFFEIFARFQSFHVLVNSNIVNLKFL